MTSEHEQHEKELQDAIDHLHVFLMESGNPVIHKHWGKLLHAVRLTEKDYQKLEEKENETA